MDFNLSEEHLAVRDAAREFAEKELLPGVIERDNEQKFPAEQIKAMGQLGDWHVGHHASVPGVHKFSFTVCG